jgi:hypothetical protein
VRNVLALAQVWIGIGLLLLAGCEEDGPAAPTNRATPAVSASSFQPVRAGAVSGQVRWEGDLPQVPPFDVYCNPPFGPPLDEDGQRANPNAPRIASTSRGVADAVVFLRGVEPARSGPWPHGPVCVEQRGASLHILQDDADSRVGFVRRGAAVKLLSQDSFFHALRASGAAFFTLTFPEPGQPLERRFAQNGLVELTSGTGYFWMRGYLFVDEQPYYTRSDAQGRFTLPDVPAGHYQLVCWHPNWIVQSQERDPETALISRLTFRPPLVQEQTVEVRAGATTAARFVLSVAQASSRRQPAGK